MFPTMAGGIEQKEGKENRAPWPPFLVEAHMTKMGASETLILKWPMRRLGTTVISQYDFLEKLHHMFKTILFPGRKRNT